MSKEDMQLNLRILFIGWCLNYQLRSPPRNSQWPSIFETKYYLAVIGDRGPNTTEPFVSECVKTPYFRNYRYMKPIGYIKPYPLTLSQGHKDVLGFSRPVEVVSERDISKAMYEFSLRDKNWTELKLIDDSSNASLKRAMDLTKQLYSHPKFPVAQFTLKDKNSIALLQDMRASPGLPFCADGTSSAQIDYLDRGFKLAIEINDSASKNSPDKVQAPACTYGLCETVLVQSRGDVLYPMAIRILESRFVLNIITTGSSGTTMDTIFVLFLTNHGPSYDELVRTIRHGYAVTFKHMEINIHPQLVEFALSIIEECLVLNNADKNVWKFLKHYFLHTPVALPTGQILETHSAGPSTSFFSYPVQGLVSVITGIYCMLRQNIPLHKMNVFFKEQILLISVPKSFSRDQFCKDSESLGFSIEEIRLIS